MPTSVSVIIPCYNQAHFLSDAIGSVLKQSVPPHQIVVVNDGSTDQTHAVCQNYGSFIDYIYQANSGLSAARNQAILRAQGDFIHLLDADDLLEPTAIEQVIAAASSNPEATVVRGGWNEITAEGDVVASVPPTELGSDPFHALFNPLAVGPPCTYMIRRSALLGAGLFDTSLKSCEDWDMWFRLALAGHHFVTIPAAVATYRRHPQSMSRNHTRMWRSGVRVLRNARARHGCALCEIAYRDGIDRWRQFCYLTTLRADLRMAVRSRHIGSAVIATARAVSADPPLVRLLIASMRRNLDRLCR